MLRNQEHKHRLPRGMDMDIYQKVVLFKQEKVIFGNVLVI